MKSANENFRQLEIESDTFKRIMEKNNKGEVTAENTESVKDANNSSTVNSRLILREKLLSKHLRDTI